MNSTASLLTAQQREQLLENGRLQAPVMGTDKEIDFAPVVKLLSAGGRATWLLAWVYPDDPDLAFGLCDLGLGSPELGDVRLSELTEIEVDVDYAFEPTGSLLDYARAAWRAGYIVE